MKIKKFERERLDSDQKIEGMEKYLYIDLESAVSKGTLIASNPAENKSYLLEEIQKPTSRELRATLRDKTGVFGNYNLQSELKGFLSGLLKDLFEDKRIFKSKIDNLFALTDSCRAMKNPEDISQLIKRIMVICEEELGGTLSKINFEKPRIAGNELKARVGARGCKRILESKLSSNESLDGYLDLSTYLSGITFSSNEGSESGLISGFGLEILDALAKGEGEVNRDHGTILQLPSSDGRVYEEVAKDLASRVSNLINVNRVPSGSKRIGGIPIDIEESYRKNVKLMGCDAGKNGDKLSEIVKIGQRAASYGLATLKKLLDKTIARLIGKIIKSLYEEELIDSASNICISSRRPLAEKKFEIISKYLEEIGFRKIAKKMIFVENPASFGIIDMKNQELGSS